MIRVEDVYQMDKSKNSRRFLIDRKWPRGVVRYIPHKEESGRAKNALAEIHWKPQLAPGPALWQWFLENPDKIDRFRRRYFGELQAKKRHWLPIALDSKKNGVTLLYRTVDLPWTPAAFFKEFLDLQLKAGHLTVQNHFGSGDRPRRGVSAPVEKAISRKTRLPLKPERKFAPSVKQSYVSGEKRRVVVMKG